jgi:hypothetical protein
MTTDLLTFFHPGKPAGTAWTFPVRSGGTPPIEIWVFTPGTTDLSRFAVADVSSEESYKRLLADIHALLQQSGGIVIRAQAHNDVVRAKLTRVEASGYTAPRSMLRLSAVGDPRFEEISEVVDLKVGEHLLVPVSQAAEERLRSFYDDLKGLPTDLETSILNVLRRPSLEWRIERIEKILSLPPATQTEWQRSRIRNETFLEKLLRIFMWRIPAGPVAAALLLTVGSMAAFGKFTAADARQEQGQEHTEEAGGNREKSKGASSQAADKRDENKIKLSAAEDPLQKSVDELFVALKAKGEGDLKSLYTSHFQGHQRDFFSKSSPGIWGIAKLQALRWSLLVNDNATLTKVDHQAQVKEAYASPTARSALEADKSAARLLAWSLCQAYGKAEMPATNTEPREALQVPADQECKELKREDAVPGLEALTDWVKGHS